MKELRKMKSPTWRRTLALLFLAALTPLLACPTHALGDEPAAAKATARWVSDDEGISLLRGEQLLFRYVFRSGNKPIIYPLLGPGGQVMTRQFPMAEPAEGGSKDHVHQRAMWLTHGEVNDIDFWAESEGTGIIAHQSVDAKSIGDAFATLQTTAHWLDRDGKPLLQEHKTMRVNLAGEVKIIDLKTELTAVSGDVNFGDTKEGSFGIRVPDSMAVNSNLGGTILNNHGQKDGAAWAQSARWVDYSGPVNGETMGITVLEHPGSFGHPCRWHVRTYGLFAANPFGVFHFVGGEKTAGHTLSKGESLTLHYRVILHAGGAEPEQIEQQWQQFAQSDS